MSLFRRDAPVETRSIDSVPWNVGGPTSSHDEISQDSALRLAPVFAAGNLLASTIAALPIQTFRRTTAGRQLVPTPPLFQSPSVIGTTHDWVYRAVLSMAYRGNAIGLVTSRTQYGLPNTVEWLRPDWVVVIDQLPEGSGSFVDPEWYYRGRLMDPNDLIHIPWFTLPWKVWGLTPLQALSTTVNTSLAAQKYKDDWFKSGGLPPGQFKNTEQVVDQADATAVKQRLVQAIRSHEPLVYGNDWEYSPFTLTQTDAQFVETMQMTATQIANVYGIPPERIGGSTGASMTYANTEQQGIQLVQFTVMPWVSRIEAVLNKCLPANQYCKFNVDELIRSDSQTRWNIHQIKRDIGATSVNEIRNEEDMPPIPKGDDYDPLLIQISAARGDPAAVGFPESVKVTKDLAPAAPNNPSNSATEGGAGR